MIFSRRKVPPARYQASWFAPGPREYGWQPVRQTTTRRWTCSARRGPAVNRPSAGCWTGTRNYLTLLARVEVGRRLQGKVDPADLVQETFLEAHRHFAAFRGTTEPELVAWLRQILAGVLANMVRHYFGTQARDVRLEQAIRAAAGPVVARPGRRSCADPGLSRQRGGRPPRAGGPARRRPRPAAGRLPRGDRAAPPGGAAVPGGGRADGADAWTASRSCGCGRSTGCGASVEGGR